ncbi:hypothetical protein CLOM_g8500 [Closterium sp. NIES-68]|nr:hypothetical protein CLOM_g8500 [Closterium sp. NIES-68]
MHKIRPYVKDACAREWAGRIAMRKMQVPKQPNNHDCGMYCMKFMQVLVEHNFRYTRRIKLYGHAEHWREELHIHLVMCSVYYLHFGQRVSSLPELIRELLYGGDGQPPDDQVIMQ